MDDKVSYDMEIEKKTRIAKAPVSVKTEATPDVKFLFLKKTGGGGGVSSSRKAELILASTPWSVTQKAG